MRVVFDTNIFVSIFAFPGGTADQALDRVIQGRDWLFVSPDLLMELDRVLSQKFEIGRERHAQALYLVIDKAEIVKPKLKINVLSDEPDNRVLECAVAARADAIVTGDKAMLALKTYKGIQIMTLREYLSAT